MRGWRKEPTAPHFPSFFSLLIYRKGQRCVYILYTRRRRAFIITPDLFSRSLASPVSLERWCRLRGNLLFYFKSREQWSEPLGVIILEQFCVRVEPPTNQIPYGFSIGEYIALFDFKIALAVRMKIKIFFKDDDLCPRCCLLIMEFCIIEVEKSVSEMTMSFLCKHDNLCFLYKQFSSK